MATQFSSLSFLANWKTKFVYFLILPIINILLLVLIDLQYNNQFNWYVASASVIIDSGALSIQAMSQLMITDANLGIDLELLAKNPYSFYYWRIKVFTSLISGIILGIVNLVLLFMVGLPFNLFLKCVVMLPLICLYGTIFGFTGWSISWQMKNPYYFSNLFASIITIVAGVLVVVSDYPKWLMLVSYAFPFYEIVDYIKTNDSNILPSILVAFIWLVIGICFYIFQIKPVLNKRIHQY